MYITSPHTTIPNLMKLLTSLSRISGLMVNKNKSIALNLNLSESTVQSFKHNFEFQWAAHSLSYLGIQLTSSLSTFYSTLEDMKKWSWSNLSWFGRISSVKMNILPKMLYLFRNLSIITPKQDLLLYFKRKSYILFGDKNTLELIN